MRIKLNISINRVIELLLFFLFILNASGGLFAPLFAVFITGTLVGASLRTAGFAIAIYAIVKSILQIPIARRIDRKSGEKDDFRVMLLGCAIGVVYPLTLMFIKFTWQLYVMEAVCGVGDACLMAAYYTIFAHHVDKGSEGVEWSIFSVFGLTVSTAVGGAIGGIIADAYGFRTTFAVAAILNLIASSLLLMLFPKLDGSRMERKSSPPRITLP